MKKQIIGQKIIHEVDKNNSEFKLQIQDCEMFNGKVEMLVQPTQPLAESYYEKVTRLKNGKYKIEQYK